MKKRLLTLLLALSTSAGDWTGFVTEVKNLSTHRVTGVDMVCTVPVMGSGNANFHIFAGVGGHLSSSQSLEHAGVWTYRSGSVQEVYTWTSLYPNVWYKMVNGTYDTAFIRPGDKFWVQTKLVQGTLYNWTTTIVNLTRGGTWYQSKWENKSSRDSAEFIFETTGGTPNISGLQFSQCRYQLNHGTWTSLGTPNAAMTTPHFVDMTFKWNTGGPVNGSFQIFPR